MLHKVYRELNLLRALDEDIEFSPSLLGWTTVNIDIHDLQSRRRPRFPGSLMKGGIPVNVEQVGNI